MDKQTSEKLNDTQEKMGATGESHSASNSSGSGESSDMSFYLIMLALIVGMGFYVSYDKEQRYGSTDSVTSTPAAAEPTVLEPIVISIEKVKTVKFEPIADIPATATTPEAIVVEKIEQKTVVTIAIIPVPEAPAVEALPQLNTESAPATPVVTQTEPAPVTPVESLMMPAMKSAMQAAEVVAAPVVQAAETMTETTQAIAEPAQAYNPYGSQYGQPQNNYYQQQPQYGNQYGNPYGNQYGNPYGNQYGNPYGYGNNPYQQPAAK